MSGLVGAVIILAFIALIFVGIGIFSMSGLSDPSMARTVGFIVGAALVLVGFAGIVFTYVQVAQT